MKDKRVTELVCATDAGREGELIFRLVYQKAGCRKPFTRLWISSLEDSAIRDGFQHLRDSSEFDRLYEAALSRSKADWIVCLLYTSGITTAAMLMVVLMLPCIFFALYEKDGQPAEKVLGHMIKAMFLRDKVRPYRTHNLYAVIQQEIKEQEVLQIEQKP